MRVEPASNFASLRYDVLQCVSSHVADHSQENDRYRDGLWLEQEDCREGRSESRKTEA